MFILGMAVGGMAGAMLGIALMCCVVCGKQEDQRMVQMQNKQLEQKRIHFRDMEGKERFALWDGESLCLQAEDGTRMVSLCHYVDENQVEVEGQCWNTAEFLWQMERRGIQVSPLEIG